MLIDDRYKIKEITLKYPSLMAEDAKQKIEEMHTNLLSCREHLTNLRTDVIKLEQELKKAEERFNQLSILFDISFEQKEIKEIKEEHNILVINPTDYRNVKI